MRGHRRCHSLAFKPKVAGACRHPGPIGGADFTPRNRQGASERRIPPRPEHLQST
jgi:hypothetical protein